MMKPFKKKRYYFSDDSVASDAVIAFIMAGLALVIELSSIIISVVTRGHVPEIYGVLYICAIIMSLVGLIFGALSFKAEEGGVKSKRMSVAVNIISLLIIGCIVLLGIR